MPTSRCCPPIYDRDLTAEAGLLKAMADPHRLTILATLARSEKPVCVCDFTQGLPINQPSVSHHLGLLREAGIVTCERRGTWAYYSLVPGVKLRLRQVLDEILPDSRNLPKAS